MEKLPQVEERIKGDLEARLVEATRVKEACDGARSWDLDDGIFVQTWEELDESEDAKTKENHAKAALELYQEGVWKRRNGHHCEGDFGEQLACLVRAIIQMLHVLP